MMLFSVCNTLSAGSSFPSALQTCWWLSGIFKPFFFQVICIRICPHNHRAADQTDTGALACKTNCLVFCQQLRSSQTTTEPNAVSCRGQGARRLYTGDLSTSQQAPRGSASSLAGIHFDCLSSYACGRAERHSILRGRPSTNR